MEQTHDSYKKIAFFISFAVISFFALQIPVFKLEGAPVAFTLFDFIAPISGAFVGLIPGVAIVFGAQVINALLHGGFPHIASVVRLFPTLFAVAYFALYTKESRFKSLILAVPLLAMVAFNLHPIGRTVWYYSLYWLIPVACFAVKDRFSFARSLGATFTAHGVGGAMWIWLFNLPANVWIGLIPQVAMERGLIAIGVFVSYHLFVQAVHALAKKNLITPVHIG